MVAGRSARIAFPHDGAPCPCGSAETYGRCCGPAHRAADLGAATIDDASSLVRARYAAFVIGHLPFIRATEARERPPIDSLDARTRYKRLELLDADRDPVAPRVLFAVDVLSRGTDASFVELSSFAREGDRWVYVSGITTKKRAGTSLAPLTIADFEARLR